MIADDMQQNLERYLSGAMSPDESRSFQARADSDPELGRLIEADRIITGAVARDRVATIPASMPASTAPGVALMAALEMSRSVVHPLVSSWMGLKVAAIGVAIGLAGLVAGSLLVVPMIERPSAPAVSAPEAGTSDVVAPGAVETPADPIDNDDESRDVNAVDAENASAPDADAAVVTRSGRAGRSTGRAPGTGTPAAAERPASATTPKAGDIDERSPASLPQIDDEKLPINVDLEKKE